MPSKLIESGKAELIEEERAKPKHRCKLRQKQNHRSSSRVSEEADAILRLKMLSTIRRRDAAEDTVDEMLMI